MSEENDKKRYFELKELVAGNHKSGNPVRDELIVSDAKRHLANLIRKRPNIQFEKPNLEAAPDEPIKETKSKGKK